MLLSADGDSGDFRQLHQDSAHTRFITLAERYPFAIQHKMGIIAHALRLILADSLRKQIRFLIETKQASMANEISSLELIEVSEGRTYPIREFFANTRHTTYPANAP